MILILMRLIQIIIDQVEETNMIVKDQEKGMIQEDIVQAATEGMIQEIVNIIEAAAEIATEVQAGKDGMKEELQDQGPDLDSETMLEKLSKASTMEIITEEEDKDLMEIISIMEK